MACVEFEVPQKPLVVLQERGDKPLAYWEEINWESNYYVYRNYEPQLEQLDNDELDKDVKRNPFSVKIWTSYLKRKITLSATERYSVYEAALFYLPRSYKLWHAYLLERVSAATEHPPGSVYFDITNDAFERALVQLSRMPRIWLMYLSFLQLQSYVTRTRRCFDRAIQCLPITQHYKIWEEYIKFVEKVNIPVVSMTIYKRYLMLEPTKVGLYIDLLKRLNRFDEAVVAISDALNSDIANLEGKSKYELWMDLCNIILEHPDQVFSIDVEEFFRAGLKRFTEHIGRLWCSLGYHYVALNQIDKAIDIFEEAVSSVSTTHDFGVIFEAYSKFLETYLTKVLQMKSVDTGEVDLLLAKLESLIERRPILLSSVSLRQNPNNVIEWINRVNLYRHDSDMTVKTFAEALKTINPMVSVGKVTHIWILFTKYYDKLNDYANVTAVFERAVGGRFKTMDDLVAIWALWIEYELKRNNFKRALELSRHSVNKAVTPQIDSGSAPAEGYFQKAVLRSTKLWSLCLDLEDSFGTFKTQSACIDKMFETKVITPSQVLNYAASLEERHYWEESFRIYERGISVFKWPNVYDVWVSYLMKFVSRYGGTKLERARELFEQALSSVPPHLSKRLFLMAGKMEEDFGLSRHAVAIYSQAVNVCDDPETIFKFYGLLIAKVSEFYGIAKTRPILEEGISKMTESEKLIPFGVRLCLRYAEIERGLGEIDRARGIFQHCSQFCDPKSEKDFWEKWREFEVTHGNEDLFRDMLRVKRAVQNLYAQNPIKKIDEIVDILTKSTDSEAKAADAMSSVENPDTLSNVDHANLS